MQLARSQSQQLRYLCFHSGVQTLYLFYKEKDCLILTATSQGKRRAHTSGRTASLLLSYAVLFAMT